MNNLNNLNLSASESANELQHLTSLIVSDNLNSSSLLSESNQKQSDSLNDSTRDKRTFLTKVEASLFKKLEQFAAEKLFPVDFLNRLSEFKSIVLDNESVDEDFVENYDDESCEEFEEYSESQENDSDRVSLGLEPFLKVTDIEDIPCELCVDLTYLITNDEKQFDSTIYYVHKNVLSKTILQQYSESNESNMDEMRTINDNRNTEVGVITIIVLYSKYPSLADEDDSMIIPELTYNDLYSYFIKNDNIDSVTNVVDHFLAIINTDIQNNYDRKEIILTFHFQQVRGKRLLY